MILATKTGWLIGCDYLRETRKATFVRAWDSKGSAQRRIEKNSETEKLFNNTDDAMAWIKEPIK